MALIITGGAGFIGSNFVLDWLRQSSEPVCVVDALTYAGNLDNLKSLFHDPRFRFVQADILSAPDIDRVLSETKPRAVLHFAAESHVDRSIESPLAFVQTNTVGTCVLLEAARKYWSRLAAAEREDFRFLHVSTDEVYGSLGPEDPLFHETTPYAPNSPYAASKAASDHFVRAYHHTYGLPVVTTHCSNNYGPFQFPEKLIPRMIMRALGGEPLTIYGDGKNIRDWLYVSDHCAAIRRVLASGRVGQTYNIGGRNELTNLQVVHTLCDLLDAERPLPSRRSYRELMTFVQDRPGHDRRYAIDSLKITKELGWEPRENFASGMQKTVQWYLQNSSWLDSIASGAYREGFSGRNAEKASA